MWKPIYQPEPWPQFRKRKDIVSLPLMEQRKKYMQEQLLFENYLSTLNTLNTVSPSVSSAASGGGGPAPGGGGIPAPVIQVLINTNFKPTGSAWNGGGGAVNNVPSTRVFLDTFAPEYANSPTDPNSDFGRPLYYKGDKELTVDWGDGTVETLTEWGVTLNAGFGGKTRLYSHDYATDGEYTITITGEGAPWAQFAFLPIVDILKYDNILGVRNTGVDGGIGVFNPITATGASLRGLFAYTFWDGYTNTPTVDITQLDVSNIVDFTGTFMGSDKQWFRILGQAPDGTPDLFSFNEDISGWDVSNAASMGEMFTGQGYFNQNLGSWDTSKVKNFYLMFRDCTRLMSGSRADLWDVSSVEPGAYTFVGNFARMFQGSMTDPSVRGSMPHVGNWTFNSISDGTSNFMDYAFEGSGFSHTAIGQSLIGWASQSALPINIGVSSNAFANTWDGSGFSNPSYNTGSAFGLEVSASYALLTAPTGSGGKGWTIPNFTFS